MRWKEGHEANRVYLEALAETWREEAKAWNKIHQYHLVALKPVLENLANNVAEITKDYVDTTERIRVILALEERVERLEAQVGILFTDADQGNEYLSELELKLDTLLSLHADQEIAISAVETSVASQDVSIQDAYECMEMDFNRLSSVITEHTKQRLAHFRQQRGGV
jgi:hypothetical protein